ncbi:hypothetical protein [Kitasatospora sp. NPDC087315]|uniref:hypothetical protein n=1 Tax=Kitasatospora sp. NPDC087315 TaxID=3364069 RepID=UPI00382DA494
MSYSRGYRVEGRGAWSRWTCEREGCAETATVRGEGHEDQAAWAAAGHQQKAHFELMVREAAEALRDAARVLAASGLVLTDLDVRARQGTVCVSPQAADQALGQWAWQLLARLPQPPEALDRDERIRWEMGQDFARQRVCEHDGRPGRPVVLLGPEGVAARG